MSCFFSPLTFLMGQCAVFCLLQQVTDFHPLPICRHCISLWEGWENVLGKDKSNASHTCPLGTWAARVTLVKKNSPLKKYPYSGAKKKVPLMLALALATRQLSPMIRHYNQSHQNKSCSSKANVSERFSYSCFTEHEMELKGNIKWVIKLKTWCLVIFSCDCPSHMYI